MRAVWTGMILALVVAGCASSNPVAPAPFETKLLNINSVAEQLASMQNMMPNSQTNYANQTIGSSSTGFAAVASAVGTGAATSVNAVSQFIVNPILQNQGQSQLVL